MLRRSSLNVFSTHSVALIVWLKSVKNRIKSIFNELKGNTALIRELHVYGKVQLVGYEKSSGAQHIGIGKNLLKMAEKQALYHNVDKIAIISGIGVRNYYKKQGYKLEGTYMIKKLEPKPLSIWLTILIVFMLLNIIIYNL
jgi:histone acetyltransferase (RNA polymerase elongator complex component)